MTRLLPLLMLLSFSAACSNDNNDPDSTDEPKSDDMSNCWWCTDATQDLPSSDMSKDSGKDKNNDNGEGFALWYGDVDLETGAGTLSYQVYLDSKVPSCSTDHPIIEWVTVDDCAECSVAASFKLGAAIDNGKACKDDPMGEGKSFAFGVGMEDSEKGGKALMLKTENDWVVAGDSTVKEMQWTFYYLGVEQKK